MFSIRYGKLFKRFTSLIIALVLILSLIPGASAENTRTYKIDVSVTDLEGLPIDLSNARVFLKCGQNVIWGTGMRMQGYGLGSQLQSSVVDINLEFWSTVNEDITYNISLDQGDWVFFISDSVKKKDLLADNAVQKTYSMKSLKKIPLKASFMNRSTGTYELSIYNPKNTNVEADNKGSTAVMKTDGSKDLYISPGVFNFAFKYLDQGVCAITCKNSVDTVATKSVTVAKESVSLAKYSYTVPAVLSEYEYYIMHVNLANYAYRAYLTGLFSLNRTLDFYADKTMASSAQHLVLSKDPEDEYTCSVWPLNTSRVPMNLGNYFRPGEVSTFKTSDGRLAIEVFFSDGNGNSVRFMDMDPTPDMVIEIYNKTTGELIYTAQFNKYWDYFNPQLKAGSYYARISPLDPVPGMNLYTLYDLKVDSKYTFTRILSLQIAPPEDSAPE